MTEAIFGAAIWASSSALVAVLLKSCGVPKSQIADTIFYMQYAGMVVLTGTHLVVRLCP